MEKFDAENEDINTAVSRWLRRAMILLAGTALALGSAESAIAQLKEGDIVAGSNGKSVYVIHNGQRIPINQAATHSLPNSEISKIPLQSTPPWTRHWGFSEEKEVRIVAFPKLHTFVKKLNNRTFRSALKNRFSRLSVMGLRSLTSNCSKI